MVEVGSWLSGGELIGKSITRLYGLLGDVGGAVHPIGEDQPVPVDAGRFGQVVGDVYAHPISFGDADARSRHLAVEGVGLDLLVGQDVPLDNGDIQVEDLDPVLDPGLERLVTSRLGGCSVGDL